MNITIANLLAPQASIKPIYFESTTPRQLHSGGILTKSLSSMSMFDSVAVIFHQLSAVLLESHIWTHARRHLQDILQAS